MVDIGREENSRKSQRFEVQRSSVDEDLNEEEATNSTINMIYVGFASAGNTMAAWKYMFVRHK